MLAGVGSFGFLIIEFSTEITEQDVVFLFQSQVGLMIVATLANQPAYAACYDNRHYHGSDRP
jgi:hypothetical protein